MEVGVLSVFSKSEYLKCNFVKNKQINLYKKLKLSYKIKMSAVLPVTDTRTTEPQQQNHNSQRLHSAVLSCVQVKVATYHVGRRVEALNK